LEIYATRPIGVADTRKILNAAVPDLELLDGPDDTTLMAWVLADEHKQIQSVLEKVRSNAGEQPGRTLQVYRVPDGTAAAARGILKDSLPSVTLLDSSQPNLLMAWVQPDQHLQIQKTLTQLQEHAADIGARTLKIYELGKSVDSDLREVLQSAAPQASMATGTHPGQLVVWAMADEHGKIRELTDGLLQSKSVDDGRLLQVYNIKGVSSAAVREVLAPLLNDDISITGDNRSERLFIRANASEHKQIQTMIDQIKPALHRPLPKVTRVYTFPNPDAEAARSAVASIVPAARLSTDSEERRLVATGTEIEQRVIAAVVQQMTEQGDPNLDRKPITYPIKRGDASNMLTVLQQLYEDRDDVQLSLDRTNKTLVAVAAQQDQQTIRTLVEQLEANEAARPDLTTRFYGLEDINGEAAKALTQTVLTGAESQGTVILESRSNQLIVTTEATTHTRIEETLQQLQQTKRILEVFQLESIGASNAQFALEGLFLDDDAGSDRAPQIQSDDESQQLLVRGTTPQIEQIRTALVKMGETQLNLDPINNQRQSLRVIPFDGNLQSTLQRLEQVWPRIRKNPLRVVVPNTPLRRIEPQPDTVPPAKPQSDKTQPDPSTECGAGLLTPADCEVQEPPALPQTSQDSPQPAASQPALPQQPMSPVIIVPGVNRLTIASDDLDALDQLESVLRSLSRSRRGNRGPEVAVYALENASADTVADTLNQLFGRNSPAINLITGSVVVVPDQRLNALVVYANPKDRPQIERLIQSLDSSNIPTTLAANQTQVLHLRSARAERVHKILSGMYKAQISSGGARRSVSIPEGVSSAVADVLRQINAAASAPLLSIEVDEPTNALIIRAPQDLLRQVTELAQQLDDAAAGAQASTISVIRLNKTRSKNVLRVLNDILD